MSILIDKLVFGIKSRTWQKECVINDMHEGMRL